MEEEILAPSEESSAAKSGGLEGFVDEEVKEPVNKGQAPRFSRKSKVCN